MAVAKLASTFLPGLWPGQPLGVLEGWETREERSGRLLLSHPLGGGEVLYLHVGVEGERSGSLVLGRGWDEGGIVRRRMVHAFCDEGSFGVRKFESDPPRDTMGRAPQYLVKAEFSRGTTRRRSLPPLNLEVACPSPRGWDPFYCHIPSLRVSAKPVSVDGLVVSPPRGVSGGRDVLSARGEVMRRFVGGDEVSIDAPRLTRRFLRRWKDLSVAEVLGLALAVSDRLRLSFQDRAVLDWGVGVMAGGVATPPADSLLAASALFLDA